MMDYASTESCELSAHFGAVVWHMSGDNHYAKIADNIPHIDSVQDEYWLLHLYPDAGHSGYWILDYDHSCRGGPQILNGIEAESESKALSEAIEIVRRHSDVWSEITEEEAREAKEEEEE